MTGYEQLFLELVNRARANPVAEAELYGIPLNSGLPPNTISTSPKPPLAPHPMLLEAARAHSKDMLDRGFFDHVNPDGQNPRDRARARGYTGSVGENIVDAGSVDIREPNFEAKVYYAHYLLFDSPGHRRNLLLPSYNEAGFGLDLRQTVSGPWHYIDVMGTQKFGTTSGKRYITGVIFDDLVIGDALYDVGEGVSDVVIRARASNGQNYEVPSGASGGYAIAVPDGSYTVSVFRDGIEISPRRTVSVASQNVKVDFVVHPRDARILLSIDKNRFDENDGQNAALLRIERSGLPTSAPMTVSITSSIPHGLKRIEHASSVVIPANKTFVEIPVHVLDNEMLEGDVRVELTASTGSLPSTTLPLTIVDYEFLTVQASSTEFFETAGGGASILVITRSNSNLSLPLTVYLTSSNTNAIRVPESVTIGAGQKSVQVGLTAVDDRLSGEDKDAEIVVEANGYDGASEFFLVKNFQAITTVLQHPVLVFSEPSLHATQALISLRNPAPAGGLLFTVNATPPGLLETPSTIRIPEGETQATLPLSLAALGIPEGRSMARITISGHGMTSDSRLVLLSNLNASWTNRRSALDVDDNGFTDPLDVLTMINAINSHGSRRLDNQREVDRVLGFVDVNGDGFIDPLDVLEVINHLNRR